MVAYDVGKGAKQWCRRTHTHIHKLLNRIKNSSVYSCLSLTGLKSIDLLLGLLIHIYITSLSLSVLSLGKETLTHSHWISELLSNT